MKSYKDIVGDGGSDVVGQVTEQANRLKARLASVRHVVAVMSGKGGVGKSTVTVNLASALALEGAAVGILDADINGPSIARMTGVQRQPLRQGTTGIQPALGALGLKVMSMALFLPDDDAPVLWNALTSHDAYTWRGMMEAGALREFLTDTEWGALDVLLIDLPPGTDKLPTMVDLLPRLSGSIVVTLPSGVSRLIVGKSISMAKNVLKTPVIGLVENMSAYITASGEEEVLFPGGQVEAWAAEQRVPFLGKIPFDPRMALAADTGTLFMQICAHTPAGEAFRAMCKQVQGFLKNQEIMT